MSFNVDRVWQVNECYVEPTQVNRVTTVRSVLFEACSIYRTALRAFRNLAFRFAAVVGHVKAPTIMFNNTVPAISMIIIAIRAIPSVFRGFIIVLVHYQLQLVADLFSCLLYYGLAVLCLE